MHVLAETNHPDYSTLLLVLADCQHILFPVWLVVSNRNCVCPVVLI